MHCAIFGSLKTDDCVTFFSVDEDDLFEVLENVTHLKACFHQLGIALKLKPKELASVYSQFSQDHKRALTEVLTLWLQQAYNVEKFGVPTWRKLVEAVDSEAGGDNHALAVKIASKYPSGLIVSFAKLSY